jgi:hypothetical protein
MHAMFVFLLIDDDRRMHLGISGKTATVCDEVHVDVKQNAKELPKGGAAEFPNDVGADVHPNKVVMQMATEASVDCGGNVGLLSNTM